MELQHPVVKYILLIPLFSFLKNLPACIHPHFLVMGQLLNMHIPDLHQEQLRLASVYSVFCIH